ncbi:unnamed protein product [Sphagnum troendelagicum]|uniref:Uncharacterized protein n=1 Tax=Sphagnum troendelagicum TaxID=128251 RepID=A0ABP0U312_9BRYO
MCWKGSQARVMAAGKDAGLTGTKLKVKKHLKKTEQNPREIVTMQAVPLDTCLKCTAAGSCELVRRLSYLLLPECNKVKKL